MNDIQAGVLWYIHFGITCTSWGPAARRNGGSRTLERPEGDGSRDKEILGNLQADRVAMICCMLVTFGYHYSIENPHSSYLWKYPSIRRLYEHHNSVFATLDQCAFGLQLPGAPKNTFCRKSTSILSNLTQIATLSKRCPGFSTCHQHEEAWGSRTVNGRSVKLCRAAGTYPRNLCQEWARVAMQSVSL